MGQTVRPVRNSLTWSTASTAQHTARYLEVSEEGQLHEAGEQWLQHVAVECIHRLVLAAAVVHHAREEATLQGREESNQQSIRR